MIKETAEESFVSSNGPIPLKGKPFSNPHLAVQAVQMTRVIIKPNVPVGGMVRGVRP